MNVKTISITTVFLLLSFFCSSCASKPAETSVAVNTPTVSDEPYASGVKAAVSGSSPVSGSGSTEIAEGFENIPAERMVSVLELPVEEPTKILRHKGTQAGTNLIPLWVTTYLDGGTEALELLKDYEGTICFVSEADSDELPYAVSAALADLPAEGSREVSTWWMQLRRNEEQFYRVFVLYTIPRDVYNRQTPLN